MNIGDIDLFEVNEAFASVVLRFCQAFDVDASKVNVNGGAIAMGHPLGATGAIIIGTLLDELERSGKGTGLATLCIASGMGAATIIETGLSPHPDLPVPTRGEGKRPPGNGRAKCQDPVSRHPPPFAWGRDGEGGTRRGEHHAHHRPMFEMPGENRRSICTPNPMRR